MGHQVSTEQFSRVPHVSPAAECAFGLSIDPFLYVCIHSFSCTALVASQHMQQNVHLVCPLILFCMSASTVSAAQRLQLHSICKGEQLASPMPCKYGHV